MTDRSTGPGRAVEIPVGGDLPMTPPLRDALRELAAAMAETRADADDVVGFQARAGGAPQFPGVEIGVLRPGSGPFRPVEADQFFCLGRSVNPDTGDSSCVIDFSDL